MDKSDIEFFVRMLDAIDVSDPEEAHDIADGVLLMALEALGAPEISEAYHRVIGRAPWWACA